MGTSQFKTITVNEKRGSPLRISLRVSLRDVTGVPSVCVRLWNEAATSPAAGAVSGVGWIIGRAIPLNPNLFESELRLLTSCHPARAPSGPFSKLGGGLIVPFRLQLPNGAQKNVHKTRADYGPSPHLLAA